MTASAITSLHKNPEKELDFLFAIEGEAARREYNNMLRRQGKPRRPGDYLSEERYGLWLGCDFVPVQRFNAWVSERSEYTRMHAFVNSDDLALTANRGSVENTSQDLLADIEAQSKRSSRSRSKRRPTMSNSKMSFWQLNATGTQKRKLRTTGAASSALRRGRSRR